MFLLVHSLPVLETAQPFLPLCKGNKEQTRSLQQGEALTRQSEQLKYNRDLCLTRTDATEVLSETH